MAKDQQQKMTPAGKQAMQAGKQNPFWQRAAVSDFHCGAGCTLGDVIGHTLITVTGFTLAGSTLFAAYVVDFSFAFLLGIAFQYFSIKPMMKMASWQALKEALKADTFSIITFEIGLFAWMALMHYTFFPRPLEATHPTFWFLMQIGMVIGFFTSYPANWWLLKRGIKHAMA